MPPASAAVLTVCCHTCVLSVLQRIERQIRRHDLIPPGGDILCLVSGGPDSTCLVLALRELRYRVAALHVDHALRGAESRRDARFCREAFGAEVVEAHGTTEAELRGLRYGFATDRRRATGHTASDQAETVLYRLVTSGRPTGIKARREDGVVRPLLELTRDETRAFCEERGHPYRVDASNDESVRGLIRNEILPLLRRLHPAADENLVRALDERRPLPRALAELLDAPVGSKRVDLGDGVQAVREHERLWLERGPVALEGEVRWGGWRIDSALPGLKVRGWRAGDRLAGRSKKIQDVFVDAKIPRSDREGWPLVVRGHEVVAVPGIVEHEGVSAHHVAD